MNNCKFFKLFNDMIKFLSHHCKKNKEAVKKLTEKNARLNLQSKTMRSKNSKRIQ
jgi:hypothetical protein